MEPHGTAESKRRAWETYGEAWATADAGRRLALLAECLHRDYVYTDPGARLTGHAPLADYMATLQARVPGMRFVTTAFDSHHEFGLVHWDMLDGGGGVVSRGISVVVFDDDGRLTQGTGFFAA